MHRKDMEALVKEARLICKLLGNNAEALDWVLNAQDALTELLEAQRWRKTDEEPPEGDGRVLVRRSGGYLIIDLLASELRDFPEKNPHWLPIPEVSDE